jgi:hypothetical protein
MTRLNVALAFVLSLGTPALGAAQDAYNGTWHLNTAKSKYDPGPGPDKATVTIKSDGKTWTVNSAASYEGKPVETSYSAKLDGTPAPIKGSPVADMVSVKKVDERTVELKNTKDGKSVGESRATMSADGKTVTVTGTGTAPLGTKMTFTAVYEKH